MKIGIANEETWSFLNGINEELTSYHQIALFKRRTISLPIFNTRINRQLFHKDLIDFMRANKVVFFEWASELLATATHLPKFCGIVTRLHRYEMYEWVDKINWEAVDKIILVCHAKEHEFINRFPEYASKIVVIPEAVDPNKFEFSNKAFNGDIGILCHLTPRKRVYELILTFYELIRQKKGLHLHIGGGPHIAYSDYYDALQNLVEKLNLQDKVTFYGNVTDTPGWYRKIDIFVSNSYSEGLQVALMEAMASRRYCLSHQWSGAKELLPKPYLYYTDNQLIEKIGDYCDASQSVKDEQTEFMRSLICENFNIAHTKVQIREVIEAAGRGIPL